MSNNLVLTYTTVINARVRCEVAGAVRCIEAFMPGAVKVELILEQSHIIRLIAYESFNLESLYYRHSGVSTVMKCEILKLIESNLTAKEIVNELTEPSQEEKAVQKPVRESRFRRKEVVAERHSTPDDMDEDKDEEDNW